jgi:AAA domain
MKIIRLTSENVKRVVAVDISPNGTLVGIGGKNGAGKSSVLDSIAYALGGERLAPTEPIRQGQAKAKITVDLGDFIVTRQFIRAKKLCTCGIEAGSLAQGGKHTPECESHQWDETRSTLAVTNKEGAKYPSPQAMLDKLLGKLTFDPLAFKDEEPKKQNEILRRLTNLDFTIINQNRVLAAGRRGLHKKTLTVAEGQLAAMPEYPGAPETLIGIDAISAEIQEGQRLQREAETRINAVRTVSDQINALHLKRAAVTSSIHSLDEQLNKLEDELTTLERGIADKQKEAEKLSTVAEEAKQKVPDFQALDTRLRDIDVTNTKVRANLARKAQEEEIQRILKLIHEEDEKVKSADQQKASMLQAAKFPIEGLGLTDDGVTWNGLPLEQASASEQLRISVAIGLALNPSIKVLLVRNGNLLDDDNLKLLAEQAEEAKAQVWMEFVTAKPEGMTVLMEDGHAKA